MELWSYEPTKEEREQAANIIDRVIQERNDIVRARLTMTIGDQKVICRLPARNEMEQALVFTCTGATRRSKSTGEMQVQVEASLDAPSEDLFAVSHDTVDHLYAEIGQMYFWGSSSRVAPAFSSK